MLEVVGSIYYLFNDLVFFFSLCLLFRHDLSNEKNNCCACMY